MEKVKNVIDVNNKRSGRTFLSMTDLAENAESKANERRSTSRNRIEAFSSQIENIFSSVEINNSKDKDNNLEDKNNDNKECIQANAKDKQNVLNKDNDIGNKRRESRDSNSSVNKEELSSVLPKDSINESEDTLFIADKLDIITDAKDMM